MKRSAVVFLQGFPGDIFGKKKIMRSSWLNECLEQERREKKDEERVRSEKRTHVGGGFKYKISTDQRTIDCTVMTVAVRRTAAFQRVNRGPVERHAPKSEDNMDSNHCYPLPVTADGHPVRSSLFLVTIRDGSQAGDMNYLACKVSLTPLNYKRVWSNYTNISTVQMPL